MDIWETLYEKACGEYHPEDVTPFIHAHHVVVRSGKRGGRFIPASALRAAAV